MNELYYYMLVWITSKVTQEKKTPMHTDTTRIHQIAGKPILYKKRKKDL